MKTFIFTVAFIAVFCYISNMEIQTNPFRIHFNALEKGIGVFLMLIGISLIIDYTYELGKTHKQAEIINEIKNIKTSSVADSLASTAMKDTIEKNNK